jgi:hypothetical protein
VEAHDDRDGHLAETGVQVLQLLAQDAAPVGQRGERLGVRHAQPGSHAGGQNHDVTAL